MQIHLFLPQHFSCLHVMLLSVQCEPIINGSWMCCAGVQQYLCEHVSARLASGVSVPRTFLRAREQPGRNLCGLRSGHPHQLLQVMCNYSITFTTKSHDMMTVLWGKYPTSFKSIFCVLFLIMWSASCHTLPHLAVLCYFLQRVWLKFKNGYMSWDL